MNTTTAHRIASLVTLAACVSLTLAACSSAPATQRPRASDTSDPRNVSASASAAQSSPRRAPPPQFLVNYSPAGNVTVISSAPPTVAQLPSGAWQVIFPRAMVPAPAPAVASASAAP